MTCTATVPAYAVDKALRRLREESGLPDGHGPQADFPYQGETCLAFRGGRGEFLLFAMALGTAFRESAALDRTAPGQAVAALTRALMDWDTCQGPQGQVFFWPSIRVAEGRDV